MNGRTSHNSLFKMIGDSLLERVEGFQVNRPTYRDFCAEDVYHPLTDIIKAIDLLGYKLTHRIEDKLDRAMEWSVRILAQC